MQVLAVTTFSIVTSHRMRCYVFFPIQHQGQLEALIDNYSYISLYIYIFHHDALIDYYTII